MGLLRNHKREKEYERQVRSWCKRYLTVDLCTSISDVMADCPKCAQCIAYKATHNLQEYLDYDSHMTRLTGMDPAEEAGTIMCGYLAHLFQKKLKKECGDYYNPINRAFMARIAPVRNMRAEQAADIEKIPGVYEYTSRETLDKDLKYWCNGVGELHFHGQHDITKEELPGPLRRAYEDLWTDTCGSICYLVDYGCEYFIALVNEWDTTEENDETPERLYLDMKGKARLFMQPREFDKAAILLGKDTGIDCHEFIVLLPAYTDKETFGQVASILRNNM